MISLAIERHYRGASPLGIQPLVVLQVAGPMSKFRDVIRNRNQLRSVVAELPQSKGLQDLLASTDSTLLDPPEQWMGAWIEALLTRSGRLRVQGFRLLAPPLLAKGTMGFRLAIDHFEASTQELRALLDWIAHGWAWCLDPRHAVSAGDLAAHAPPAKYGHKPSLIAMARVLWRQGIPFRLTESPTPLLQVGLGSQGQRISQKVTDGTSGWGLQHAKDKVLSKDLLVRAGFPTARAYLLDRPDQARAAAAALGYPVVTKPVGGDQGRGVITNITTPEELDRAYSASLREGGPILLEKQVPGRDFRFLVVRGHLFAALERVPAGVRGDGSRSVQELIKVLNEERRGNPVVVEGEQPLRYPSLELDQEAERMLAVQGYTAEAVPSDGEYVRLRYSANFSVGGSVRECLQELHPVNHTLIEKTAALFRLDVAGIDVIAPTLESPIMINGGVICEVNGMPGVLPHMMAEPHRCLMAEMAASLLATSTEAPLVVAVHGDGAGALIAQLEPRLLARTAQLTVAYRHGLRRGGQRWNDADNRGFDAQQPLLLDPTAEAFLLEFRADDLQRHGLAWPHIDLLILCADRADPMDADWEAWLVGWSRRTLRSGTRVSEMTSEAGQSSHVTGVVEAEIEVAAGELINLLMNKHMNEPHSRPAGDRGVDFCNDDQMVSAREN